MPVTVNVDNGQRRLTLRLDGPGRVYLNDEPVLDSDAGLTTAEFTFQPGDEVQLTAEPIEACDLFVGWGDAFDGIDLGSDAEIPILINSDRDITANFSDNGLGDVCDVCPLSAMLLVALAVIGWCGRDSRMDPLGKLPKQSASKSIPFSAGWH